jgi:hypothetical protein
MENLDKLKSAVFAKRQELANIYASSSTLSLKDYAFSWQIFSNIKGANVLANKAQILLEKTHSKEITKAVVKQLKSVPLVSSIDHHGIINHPFFVNSNLIYSQRPNLDYLICLSTAGISLNNSSWPGCLLATGSDGRMVRFPFFSGKFKNTAVLSAPALGKKEVLDVKIKIQSANIFSQNNKDRLLDLVAETFQNESFYNKENFSQQACYASEALWAKVFPLAPKLIYLPLEEIIKLIFEQDIYLDKAHVLHKLFFSAEGWAVLTKHFSGIDGSFGQDNKGSFLFWGINSSGRRVHLSAGNNKLTGDDFIIEGDARSLIEGLSSGRLYPGSLVCFLVLLFYGITCLGGFNQVNWLTVIKKKFVNLLNEIGESAVAGEVALVPANNFAEGSLIFDINSQDKIYKPTLLDLFLKNDPRLFEKYSQLAKHVTLGESIEVQLPEIYKVITPANERLEALLAITQSQIISQSGLGHKILSVLK